MANVEKKSDQTTKSYIFLNLHQNNLPKLIAERHSRSRQRHTPSTFMTHKIHILHTKKMILQSGLSQPFDSNKTFRETLLHRNVYCHFFRLLRLFPSSEKSFFPPRRD